MENSIEIKIKADELMQQNRFSEAKEVLLHSLDQHPDDTDLLLGLGICASHVDNAEDAKSWLKQAVDKNANNPSCYLYLADLHKLDQEVDDAIENYQMAIALNPELVKAHLNIAGLYMGTGEYEDAEYHYQYVIDKQPDNADAYANLAQVQEMLNKIDNARSSAISALGLRPNHAGALMALGKIEKREKNYSQAIEHFHRLTTLAPDSSVAAMAYIEMGHCHDKEKDFDDASNAFNEGKKIWTRLVEHVPFDTSYYSDRIDWIRSLSTSGYFSSIAAAQSDRRDPIFFVACPRSGTTLLEKILKQNPTVRSSDEEPFIDNLIKQLEAESPGGETYPELLNHLDQTQLDELRNRYWEMVDTRFDDVGHDNVFIDKYPMNIVDLCFIKKLFPASPILVAIRDPRDVCLSCFMQAFVPNPAMINFLSMSDTIDFYVRIMDLWNHYKTVIPDLWFEYRYEDLIENFDSTSREIFSFLSLDYPEDAARFYQSTATKAVTTPSYQDISKPLYTRSIQRWKHYQSLLKPYEHKLDHHISNFGYSN